MSTSEYQLPVLTDLGNVARDVRALAGAANDTSVALVPTMGALHKGHLALVKRAKKVADLVVVSIFVNPLQFAPGDDFERYPRALAQDVEKLAKVGAHAVFAPSAEDMYPKGSQIRVHAGPVGETFEGLIRPRHFDGVLTVLTKLFNLVRPDVAVFGRKDAQQVFLVQKMVRELNLPLDIEVVETVRTKEGLALSSRNSYLSDDERGAALVLHRALDEAEDAAHLGVDSVIRAAQGVLMNEPMAKLDYLTVVNPATFVPVDANYRGDALLVVAAKVGQARLIDNQELYFS